jgi:hypothetical protein
MVRRARIITVRFIGPLRYRLDVGESLPTVRPVVRFMPNEPGASEQPVAAIGVAVSSQMLQVKAHVQCHQYS